MRRAFLVISLLSAALGAIFAEEHPKRRVPSGFTGVRGKKSIPDGAFSDASADLAEETGPDGRSDKRAPSGFLGMRGKKPFPDPDDQTIKRAPSGFFGVRGKKEMELDDFAAEYKRTPSGFFGMRGKKDDDVDVDAAFDPYTDKRAPSGFMGMRGKKTFDSAADEAKRAQMSGFFGMRGKKQPSRSGFFGMRGKKYPYEFRGKFVGVRGKKDEVGDYGYMNGRSHPLARVTDGLDLNQLMLLLTENSDRSWRNENNDVYENDRV